MGRKDFKDKQDLEFSVHNVIKGSKTKDLPSECPVDPYGGGIRLPKVISLTCVILSSSIASFELFEFMFLLSLQGHVEFESFPPLLEDPTSFNVQMDVDPEDLEETLPSATSPDDQGGDSDSSSDNEAETFNIK